MKTNHNEQEKQFIDMMTSMLSASILHVSDGNPGAIKALMEVINSTETQVLTQEERIAIMTALRDGNIHGADIYVFWSDICDKDLKCMAFIAKNTSSDLLVKACAVEDYSGRVLLKKQLSLYKSSNNETD